MNKLISLVAAAVLTIVFNLGATEAAYAEGGVIKRSAISAQAKPKKKKKAPPLVVQQVEEEIEAPDTIWRCTFTVGKMVSRATCKPYLYVNGKRTPIKVGKREKPIADELQKMLIGVHKTEEYPIKQDPEEGGDIQAPVDCSIEVSRTFDDDGTEDVLVTYLSGTCPVNKYAYKIEEDDIPANTDFCPSINRMAGYIAYEVGEYEEAVAIPAITEPQVLKLERDFLPAELHAFLESRGLKSPVLDECWRGNVAGLAQISLEKYEATKTMSGTGGQMAAVVWHSFAYRPEVFGARILDPYTRKVKDLKVATQNPGSVKLWNPYTCNDGQPRPVMWVNVRRSSEDWDHENPTPVANFPALFKAGQGIWVVAK